MAGVQSLAQQLLHTVGMATKEKDHFKYWYFVLSHLLLRSKKFYKIFQRNSLRLCCFSVILFVAYSLISAFKSVICFFLLSIYLVGYLTAGVQVLFFLIYKVKAVNFLPIMALSLVRTGPSLSLPPSLSPVMALDKCHTLSYVDFSVLFGLKYLQISTDFFLWHFSNFKVYFLICQALGFAPVRDLSLSEFSQLKFIDLLYYPLYKFPMSPWLL